MTIVGGPPLGVCRLSELVEPWSGVHIQAARCTHRREHPGPVAASAARPPASDELSSITVAAFDTPAPRVPGFQPTGRKDSHCKLIRRPWL